MIRQLIGLSLAVACVAISGCEKDASTAVVASSLTQSPEPAVEAMTISPRSTELFVENWVFHLGDLADGADPALDDSTWRVLDLPHDWSIEGEYTEDSPATRRGGFLPGGIAWYRKSFDWDPEWEGKSVRLTFDGVYMNSTVFINGRKLAHQPYGYVPINVNLSNDLLKSTNVIAVRVDNEKLPSGRWYTGSGIYRDVWLTVSEPVHVVENGSFIRSEDVTAERAVVLATHANLRFLFR